MEHGLIHDLAICITVAWLLALIAQLGKQPLILAYLIAGFVIGPLGFQWVASQDSIKTIAELGLLLLLFMIGLEIDLKKILGAGRLITLTGASQILGGFGLGLLFFWGVSQAMGLQRLEIICLAAATLSSTVIVVKLFSDVSALYAAGADYVCLPRLMEAMELRNLLEEKRSALDQELKDRQEVIP